MDLPLLLSAFSSLATAFIVSAVWATRPAGASAGNTSHSKNAGQDMTLQTGRAGES